MARTTALPPNLPPRLLDRAMAAAYLGVAPATFDRMVAEGMMPPAKRLYGVRKAWCRIALDRAIDMLPDDGTASGEREIVL